MKNTLYKYSLPWAVTLIHRLFSFILFVMVCLPAAGQEIQEDVVYLKNGSVIHGTILEQKPGEYIKIQTADRNIWVFRMDEIDRITRETYIPDSKARPLPLHKGYFNVSEIGIAVSQGTWSGLNAGFSVSTVNGYRFNRFLSTGVMTGLDHYNGLPIIPVGIDVRGTLLNRSLSPFYFGEAGYGFPVKYENDPAKYYGGLLLQVGGGMMFTLNDDCAFVWSLSFKSQRARKTFDNWGGLPVEEKSNYKRISVKVGLMF